MELSFESDRALRQTLFLPGSFAHPAKCHLGALQWLIDRYTQPGQTIGDPMAGSGSLLIATLSQRNVILRDVEPRWINLLQQNAEHIRLLGGLFAGLVDIGQADARKQWGWQADHLIFSPPYGSRSNMTAWRSPKQVEKLRNLVGLSNRWESLLKKTQVGSWGSLVFSYGTQSDQIGHFRGTRYWEASGRYTLRRISRSTQVA